MTSDISDRARTLLATLDELPDPAWHEGRAATAGITIAMPAGPRCALDAPDLDAWLVAHSEPAPFGDATGTRHDRSVRDARRVTSRGETRIVGFDPADVLGEIERALATDCHLAAELLDVLVYTRGSHFVGHKDTPRTDDQLGTLVVELPHAHAGGALRLVDSDRAATIDWSGSVDPSAVRWVAMFGDVDHEVAPVTDGVRLTAVYTLRYRTGERVAAADRERLDAVIDAAIALHDDNWSEERYAIPCSRMIVAPRDAPPTHAALRGADRLIAAALERAGIAVTVHDCIVIASSATEPLPVAAESRGSDLRCVLVVRPIPPEMLAQATAISWDPSPYGPEQVIAAVAPYVDAAAFPSSCMWLVRTRARVVGRDIYYSHTGYFGNEYSAHYMYRFAMMLATVPAREY